MSKIKRMIVLLLAVAMLVTGSGFTVLAESVTGDAEPAVTESQAEDKDQQEAEPVAKADDDAKVEEKAKAEDKAEAKDSKADEAKAETKADWEKTIPSDLPADVREAVVEVAKSQLKAAGSRYTTFTKADSEDWDASFVMFVLNYAEVKTLKKADDIHFDAETAKWMKALDKADMLTKEGMPEEGDIVFIGKKADDAEAAVVIDADDDELMVIGAKKDAVSKFKAEDTLGFVSLKAIVPDEFKEEAVEENAEEATDEDAVAEDKEDAENEEELTEEELEAKKAEEQAAAAKKAEEEAAAKAAEEAAKAEEAGLTDQTVEAELTSAPGFGGKLRSLFTSDNGTEISISGYMPEDATVKAYPVKVEIPGQNVLAAYDITIYTKDEDGNDVEWQPEIPLSVVMKSAKIGEVENAVSIYHMEDKKAAPEFIGEASVEEDKAEFTADSFSIYVATTDPTVTYEFYNGSDIYSKQILKNGQNLVEPTSPIIPGAVFKHWSTEVNGETAYSGFNQPVPVGEGGGGTVKLYAVYETQKYRVTFYDQTGGIVEIKMVSGSETIDPDSVKYTPIQNKEGVHLEWQGWTRSNDGNGEKQESFTASEDVELYPIVREGRWIYFDVNKAAIGGSGDADYPAPVFVLPGESNKPGTTAKPVSVTRCPGYEFLGWFTKKSGGYKVFDAAGIRNDEGYAKITKNGELYNEPTLYAHWTKGTATYQVVYYVQKASDGISGEKHYEFYKAGEVRRAAVGSEVSRDPSKDTEENVFDSLQDQHGFTLSDVQNGTVVKADGTSELQVRFDRKPYTLKFYNFAQNNSKIGTAVQDNVVTTNSSAYTSLPSNTTGQYSNYDRDENGGNYYAYFWNRFGTNYVTSVTALYGHDISNQFDFPVYYRRSTTNWNNPPKSTDSVSWPYNANWTACYKVAWYDANQQSHITCGLRDMFRILYKMPALYDNNGEDYEEEVLIHNSRVYAPKNLYYYKEEIYNSGHDYKECTNANLGQKYLKKDFGNGVSYFVLANTTPHNYGPVAAFNSDALFQPMEGYNNIVEHCEPTNLFEMGNDGKPVNMPPNKSAAFYTLKSYDLILTDPTGKSDDIVIPSKYMSSLTDADLAEYYDEFISKEGVVPTKQAEETGKRWYRDESLTNPVDYETFTMPSRSVTLYAGVKEQYIVCVDPAGGELFGSNGSSLGNDYSTWFRADRGTYVKEYENVKRDYVEADSDEATYKYVKYDYDPSDTSKPRTAIYEKTAVGATHKYEKGAYVFTGWYKVTSDSEELYDFGTPIESNITLRAKWRRNANFKVVYDTDDASVKAPVDNNRYEDGAHAIVEAPLDVPENKRFTGWQVVGKRAGQTVKPNQTIEISEAIANLEDDGSMSITLKAQYADYQPQSYMMADYTFMNGNDVFYVETISAGEKLVLPPKPNDPNGSGVFSGWFTDPACKHRFNGFGTVNEPVYTTLYAGYENGHTVYYYNQGNNGEKGDTIIATQRYAAGASLNTTGVTYTGVTGTIVEGWTTNGNDTIAYNSASTGVTVGSDMELWPKTITLDQLTFDSKGGSHVDPVTIPLDGRPAAPKEPEREGFIFAGWFTDESYTTEYDFSAPLPAGVMTLYAKWEADPDNPANGELTILIWAQTPERPENDANDKNSYELADSIQVVRGYGSYDLDSIENILDGENVDYDNPAKVLGNVRTRYPDADDVAFNKFFEFDTVKSRDTVVLDKEKGTVFNLYYDRKEYTLKFDIQNLGKIYYGNKNEKEEYTGSQYSFTTWLDQRFSTQWPVVSDDRKNSTSGNSAWVEESSSGAFGGWRQNSSTILATIQLIASSDIILNAADNGGTFTFTASRTDSAKTRSAVVYYYLDGNSKEEYKQDTKIYPNAGSYSNYYRTVNNVKIYTKFLPKEIEGYDLIKSPSQALEDGKYNPLYDGDYRSVREDTNPTKLYFYYRIKSFELTLKKDRADSNPQVFNVPYNTKLTGEDGYLATHDATIPPAPAGMEFACWSPTAETAVEYSANGGCMPAHAITLYATWRPIQVEIKTNVEGSEATYPKQDYGTKFEDFHIPEPEKEGNIFIGWQTSDGKWVTSKDSITSDMILYARFRDIRGRSVTYHINGATSGSAPEDNNKYAPGTNVVVKSGDGLRKTLTYIDGTTGDADFVYWCTSADGKGVIYYPGSLMPLTNDVTLYAIFTDKRDTDMFYHKNGASAEFVAKNAGTTLETLNEDEGTIRVIFRDYGKIPAADRDKAPGYPNYAMTVGHDNKDQEFFVRRPGYKFDNWSCDPAATDGNIENDQTVYVNTLGSGNAIYAIWDDDRLPLEVYQYSDNDIADADQLNTYTEDDQKKTLPGYQQMTVDTSAQTPQAVETAYRTSLGNNGYSIDSDYNYEKAMVGDDEIDKLQYVLKSDGTGYEWQYHKPEATKFEPVGDETVKIYYHKVNDGFLTITKEVTGEYANMQQEFTFTLLDVDGAGDDDEFAIDKAGSDSSTSETIKQGGEFTLKNGQSAVITVPRDTKITIKENQVSGYTSSFALGQTGTTDEGDYKEGEGDSQITVGKMLKLTAENGSLTVTNNFDSDQIVPSGIKGSNSILIPLFLALLLAFGVVMSIRRRRRMGIR